MGMVVEKGDATGALGLSQILVLNSQFHYAVSTVIHLVENDS
jgi:hypothetical protein